MIKRHLSKAFAQGGVGRQMVTVLTGTGLAQFITLLSAPILTRIYDPDQYGIYANVAGICALAAVVATGRYESSIIIPTNEREATACLKLSLWIAGIVSLGFLLVVTVAGELVLKALGLPFPAAFLYVVPIYTLFGGAYQAVYSWLVRTGGFRAISLGRIGAAAASVVVTLGIGMAHPQASGLVAGLLAGQAFACLLFVRSLDEKTWRLLGGVTQSMLRSTATRFRRFPLYAVPADLCNSASQQMPSLLLLAHFGPGAAGLFALTQRMLNLPISLLSSSILDVFKKRAADDLAAQGECRRLFLKTMAFLACIALLPLVAIVLMAPSAFQLAFGAEWMKAGVYAQILAPMFYFRFVASPLSYLLYLTERQSFDLAGNIAMLAVSSGGILLGAYQHSVELGLAAFSGGCSVIYILYLLFSYQCSRGPRPARR